MERRIITTELMEEDQKNDSHLRPQYLDDYIGQEKIKSTLKIYIDSSQIQRARAWIMCCFTVRRDLVKQRFPGLLPMRWVYI